MTRTWDAAAYDRVSAPQLEWARGCSSGCRCGGDETVLDAGCGSGNVTQLLLDRLPRGHVVAVDSSESMVEHARQALDPERTTVFQADLAELELDEQVDAAFSNAVFHWIPDHDALFAHLHAALRPGGLLVAQCGGEGNVARFHAAAREVAAREPVRGAPGRTGPGRGTSPAPRRPPSGSSEPASRRSTPGSSPIRSPRTTRSRS